MEEIPLREKHVVSFPKKDAVSKKCLIVSLSELDVEENDEGVNCEEDEEDFSPVV